MIKMLVKVQKTCKQLSYLLNKLQMISYIKKMDWVLT